MPEQINYTTDQLHQLFIDYLIKKFDGDSDEAQLYIDTAEKVLPNTLNDYFGTNLKTIYELQDVSYIDELRLKIKAHPVLKNVDREVEPRYTEVLKWYMLFVRNVHNNITPILVPGEDTADGYDEPEQHAISSKQPEEKDYTTRIIRNCINEGEIVGPFGETGGIIGILAGEASEMKGCTYGGTVNGAAGTEANAIGKDLR